MAINRTTIQLGICVSDPLRWGSSHTSFAVASDCRLIAVRPTYRFDNGDERQERVYIYDFEGKLVDSFRSPHGGEQGILFWPDDRHLLMPGYDLAEMSITVLHRSLLNSRIYRPFRDTALDGTSQWLLGASSHGRYVAGRYSGANNLGCWFYDGATQTITKPARLDWAINRAVFSPNHRYLAMIDDEHVAAGDYRCFVIDLTTGEQLFSLIPTQGTPLQMTRSMEVLLGFSSDGSRAISCCASGFVLRALPDGAEVHRVPNNSIVASTGCVSQDGRLCAVGTVNGGFALISTETLTSLARYESGSPATYEQSVREIHLSGDNQRVVVIFRDAFRTFQLHPS
jgi:WD40 repeat protein